MMKKFEIGYTVCAHTLGDGKVIGVDNRKIIIRFDNYTHDVIILKDSELINYVMYGKWKDIFGQVKDGDPMPKMRKVYGYQLVKFVNNEWVIMPDYYFTSDFNYRFEKTDSNGYRLVKTDIPFPVEIIEKTEKEFEVIDE